MTFQIKFLPGLVFLCFLGSKHDSQLVKRACLIMKIWNPQKWLALKCKCNVERQKNDPLLNKTTGLCASGSYYSMLVYSVGRKITWTEICSCSSLYEKFWTLFSSFFPTFKYLKCIIKKGEVLQKMVRSLLLWKPEPAKILGACQKRLRRPQH